MNFLIVSKSGDATPLATRLESEGHNVKIYIEEWRYRTVGDGIINKIKVDDSLLRPSRGPQLAESTHSNAGGQTPKPHFNRGLLDQLIRESSPDCIIFDMVGFGRAADALRQKGFKVFGGSLFADLIELDRSYGTKIMRAAKIGIPETFNFKYPNEPRRSFESAIEFVNGRDQAYVFKPNGNQDTSLTFVPQSKQQLLGMLEHWRDTTHIDDFDLQEKIDGIEVSTEGWFNGSRFMTPINSTFEDKRLMPSDKFHPSGLGPKTGSMASVVINYGEARPRLFKEGLSRVEPLLRKASYRGPLDLNTIVTKDKIYALEWTARLGYDAVWALLEGLKMRISDLIIGTASGAIRRMNLGSDVTSAIRVSIPPYPNESFNGRDKGLPIFGITPQNKNHIFLSDVLRDTDGSLKTNGADGLVCIVTSHAQTIPLTLKRARRTISDLQIPNLQFRSDGGERAEESLQTLKEWGWV